MAKKKTDGLTTRQRQSQQIMQQKAAQKKRKLLMRKVHIGLAAASALTVITGSLWGWHSGFVSNSLQKVSDSLYGLTGKAGFSVQALYLEGRNRTPMTQIDKALGIKKGEPILQFSLEDARERLEQIESIRYAAVERALPGALYVRIAEREPVALWQQDGRISLVDDNGVVMSGIDIAPYSRLPLIVGDDAPKHVNELMEILALEPELLKRFSAAIRVGARRWNIRMENDIEIKLPEDNAADAWKKLAELQAKERLLDRDVKVIDLRLPDRLFIKLTPGAPDKKTATARDT